jgi:hypothetical protein
MRRMVVARRESLGHTDARSGPGRLLPVVVALLALTAATPAHSPEAVAVRAGIHSGFGRLVLEWPAPVEVEGQGEGTRYRLRFGRPLAAVLDAAVARLGDYLESAQLRPDGRELVLELAPGIAVRQTVEGGRTVVLDLAPAAAAGRVEVRTGLHDGFARVVFDWPEPTRFEATAAAEQVEIRFSRAGAIDTAEIAPRLSAWLEDARASRGAGGSEVRLELQPGVSARVFRVDEERIAVDLSATPARGVEGGAAARAQAPAARVAPTRPPQSAPAPAPAAPVRPPEGAQAPAAPRSTTAPTPAPELEPAAPPTDQVRAADLRITAGTLDDGAVLDFAWTRPVAAAVFVRAAHLWVVFAAATSRAEDLALPPAVGDYLGQGERIAARGGTAFRFALLRPLAAAAHRDDRTWRVRLSAAAPAPRFLYPLRLAEPARLRLAPGEAPRLVVAHDPETGDRLTVWPLLQPGLGQPRQSFVELELPATAQGLTWRLRSDRVQARTVGHAVEFDAPGGLALSEPRGSEPSAVAEPPALRASAAVVPAPPPAVRAEPVPAVRAEPMPAARTEPAPAPAPIEHHRAAAGAAVSLGLVGRGLRPADTAPERRVVLLQALAEAAPDERNARRLELARYYLSRALAAEALGVLGALQGPEDEATRRARQALSGGAELLMGRIDAAAAALGATPFDDDPEVALWRAAIAAGRQDWPQAARELERTEQVLATYPQALRVRLGLAAARAAIETGDAGLAATLLEQLEGLELAPGERARLAFLGGVASAQSGAPEAADAIWRTLEHDGPVEVRVQAAFARTELLLEAGELEPAEAIARLAGTRGLWAGHPWEERMLARLAQIYLDAGDPVRALRTWRELLERYPATVEAAAITARTRDTLVEALSADGKAALAPVPAYALWREFEQLVPNDGQGDALRRRMAERLAGLDLIRPAAALLDGLLTARLAGVDKAAAGAELAELWLREPAPEAALSALERSQIEAPLPPALDQRRRILEADALARLERRAAARAALDGLDTPAADALRIALLWQEQDWPRLVAAIEHVLARRAPGAPLAEDEQAMVVELAIAHARLGNDAALAELRTRFAAALRSRPLEPAFLMATNAPVTAGAPAAVLAAAARHLQRVRGYLAAARTGH